MNTPKKKCELDKVLHLLSLDKTKKEIQKKLGIKPSALSNRLRRLEDVGCIERKGKYIIKVLRSSHKHPKVTKNQVHIKLNKRCHAVNVKVIFQNEQDLKQKPEVIKELKQKKLEIIGCGSYKLKKDKTTIWINKNSLTLYSSNFYCSKNALHSKFRNMKDIDNLVQYLKDRYNFRGIYGIEIFREHYGLIFNKFAKWLLEKGGKMYVKNKGNKTILWVDDSRKDDINLKELEGKDPLKINSADNYFKSHEETNWKVTPEFILEGFAKTSELIKDNSNQLKSYAENVVAHVEAVKGINKGLERQNKIFDLIEKKLKNDN